MAGLLVKDIIERNLLILAPETKASEAARKMVSDEADCIVVIVKGRPIGVVTASDFLRRVVGPGKNADTLPLSSIMSKPVIVIDEEESLREASRLMATSEVRRLIVMSGTSISGIVTSTSVLGVTSEMESKETMEEDETFGPRMCEACGTFQEVLHEVDGKWVCASCKDILSD
jgi:CBS domain-containing protein